MRILDKLDHKQKHKLLIRTCIGFNLSGMGFWSWMMLYPPHRNHHAVIMLSVRAVNLMIYAYNLIRLLRSEKKDRIREVELLLDREG